MGIALALGSMLCFGLNILITRHALTHMPVSSGFFVVLGVNIVFAALAWGVQLLLREVPVPLDWAGVGWFAAAGVIGTWLSRRTLFDTVELLGPARASVFHSTAPVFSLLAAWVLVGELVDGYAAMLMVLVISGLWISQSGAAGGAKPISPEALRRGAILGLLTVAGFGISNALRGVGLRGWNEPLLGLVVSSGVAFILQCATTRNWPKVASDMRGCNATGWVLYAAAGVATVGGPVFVSMAMLHIEIALAALVTHTTPLLIFPVTVFFYKQREILTKRTLGGTALVLIGILLLALR